MIASTTLVNSKNIDSSNAEKTFMNIKPKLKLITVLSACLLAASVSAATGSADPAVVGATHIPQTVAIGQTSVLHTDFVNAGFDPIPVHSISVSICGAASYYRSSGITPPTGYGTYFTWTHPGSQTSTPPSTPADKRHGKRPGQYAAPAPAPAPAPVPNASPSTDCWIGINNVVIPALAGGTILVNYTGVSASPLAQTTLVHLETIANPASFTNDNKANNETSATLAIVGAAPIKR